MQPWQSGLRTGLTSPPRALPPGAVMLADLHYGAHPAQRLDAYLPAVPAGPVIVLIHGGAWAIGDKLNPGVVVHKVAHWLPRGHVLVSINYRLLPEADPLQQARDAAQALAFIQAQAQSWGANGARTVLLGHSTGAHLAALLAADPALPSAGGARPWLATVLLDSAALDVVATMRGPHLPLHDRAFGEDPAAWQEASPLHRLRGPPAPMLLVHAADRIESGAQAARFASAVVALGGRAEVLHVPWSHAETNRQVGRDPVYTGQIDTFLATVGVD